MRILSAAMLSCFLMTQSAGSAEFTRPLTIIVPFAPGGTVDQTARLVGERLSAEVGQPVIIENKTGANGQVAAAALKAAPPDGHTILLVSQGMLAINPALYSKLPYATSDFTPLTLAIKVTHLLMVASSSKPKTAMELVARAKEQPGELKFASNGLGSGGHLAAELFKTKAGIEATHVPYRGSTAAQPDVLGGRIDFLFDGPGAWMELVRGGQLRALAVTDDRRMPQLPDVPTMAEAGYPGVELNTWFGFAAPAKTPKDVAVRLHTLLTTAIKEQSFGRKVGEFGAVAVTSESMEAFGRFIAEEGERLGTLVKASGGRIE